MTNRTTQKYLGIRTVLSPDSVLNLNVHFSAHDHRSAHTKNTLERSRTLLNALECFKCFITLQNTLERFKTL